jgi:hypothetical protein
MKTSRTLTRVVGLLFAGCGGNEASGSGTTTRGGGGDTCSYPWEHVSPEQASAQGPDCGGRPGDPLPCGACDGSVPQCRVGHNRECPGVPAGDPSVIWSPYDEWLCVCASGVWDCKVQFAAGAVCPPGTDGGV